MADYRTVHVKMWQDEWFTDLPTAGKLLFVYLVTNRAVTIAGIYRLPLKFMVVETGLGEKRIRELLGEFQQAGKVEYEDGIVWVRNLRKYQVFAAKVSLQVQTRIEREIAEIPDCPIKRRYLAAYGMGSDTPPIPPVEPPDTSPDGCADTLPNLTSPYPTKPNRTKPNREDGAKPARPAEVPSKCSTREIQDAYERLAGFKVKTWRDGESAAAKDIAREFTVAEFEQAYRHFKADKFWQGKRLELKYLVKQMPAYFADRRNNHGAPPADEPRGLAVIRDYRKAHDG